MKTSRMFVVPVLVLGATVFARDAVNAPVAPLRPTIQSIKCAAGLRAVSDGEMIVCSATGVVASERLNGPAIGLHKNGVRASQGVYVNGNREGLWTFFDEQGNKTKEIEFKGDHYDGTFIKYASGVKVLEHTYVSGKRHGPQVSYEAGGRSTVVEFRDDQPAQK